jgi:hypothetical protein
MGKGALPARQQPTVRGYWLLTIWADLRSIRPDADTIIKMRCFDGT